MSRIAKSKIGILEDKLLVAKKIVHPICTWALSDGHITQGPHRSSNPMFVKNFQ